MFPFDDYEHNQIRLQIPHRNIVEPIPRQRFKDMKLSAETFLETGTDAYWSCLTNLSRAEFVQLFEIVSEDMIISTHVNNLCTPKTRFLILLTFLKHGSFVKKLCLDFGISFSYGNTIVWDTIRRVKPPFEKNLIKWTYLFELHQKNRAIPNEPYLLGYVDATVQSIRVNHKKNSDYYSGKHKLYCMKTQAFVTVDGQATHLSDSVPGSIHDIVLCRNSGLINLLKLEYENIRPLFNHYPKIYGDRGYQGLSNDYQGAITIKKKPRGGQLSQEDIDFNSRITHYRILVENWFGRLKELWNLMRIDFRYKKYNYKKVFVVCAALTNFHIQKYPLRNHDRAFLDQNSSSGDDFNQ